MGLPQTFEDASAAPCRQYPVDLDEESSDETFGFAASPRKRTKVGGDDEPPKKRTRCCNKDGKSKKSGKGGKDTGEKRLARFRSAMPGSHRILLERATTQRMFVINRTRPDSQSEDLEIAGSTGNLYTITISHKPSCNCPHALKGNECKHIVYALHNVLKAPAHLQYQRAFLIEELKEIFAKAPPLPGEKAEQGEVEEGGRKDVEGECPICCVDFEDTEGEGVVWCKNGCGNNLHSRCFEQWKIQKRATGGGVTCPFCRCSWDDNGPQDTNGAVEKDKGVIKDGYVNVAAQLGMSGLRDTSTYHTNWVRQQRRRGHLLDEDPTTARWY